ncbi:MAG: transposase, partial [Actinomycetota bacterium]|nr:transposase [Actinomycetota bacterium]
SWFGALRICALDGTILTLPNTEPLLGKYSKQAGYHGGTGYPQARVVALIACGTRSIIDAVFGPTSIGETTQTPALLPAMGPGMFILADRNFAAAALLHQISDTGAHYLVRVKNGRHLPVHQALPDGSYLSVLAGKKVRVITATITLHTAEEERTETYRLVTNLTDCYQPRYLTVGRSRLVTMCGHENAPPVGFRRGVRCRADAVVVIGDGVFLLAVLGDR